MQALKALVIAMAVLIVAGVTIVVVTVYNRLNARAAPPPRFDVADLTVPAGCSVAEMVPAGDRLLLRLGGGTSCDTILIVELATGALLGRIDLRP